MKRIIAAIAVALTAVVAFSVTACSSGGSSSTPPSAVSVLQQDGYTQLSNNLFPAGSLSQIEQYASSVAWGDNNSGDIEFVAVIKPEDQSAIQQAMGSANLPSGVTDSYSDGVLRIDGSEAAFSA